VSRGSVCVLAILLLSLSLFISSSNAQIGGDRASAQEGIIRSSMTTISEIDNYISSIERSQTLSSAPVVSSSSSPATGQSPPSAPDLSWAWQRFYPTASSSVYLRLHSFPASVPLPIRISVVLCQLPVTPPRPLPSTYPNMRTTRRTRVPYSRALCPLRFLIRSPPQPPLPRPPRPLHPALPLPLPPPPSAAGCHRALTLPPRCRARGLLQICTQSRVQNSYAAGVPTPTQTHSGTEALLIFLCT
jgi:hypothetical protein